MRNIALYFCVTLLVVLMAGCSSEGEPETIYNAKYTVGGTATKINMAWRNHVGIMEHLDGWGGDGWLEESIDNLKDGQWLQAEAQPASDDGTAYCTIEINGEVVSSDEVDDWLDMAVCSHRHNP